MAILDKHKKPLFAAFVVMLLSIGWQEAAKADSNNIQPWSNTYQYEEDLGYDGGGTSSTGNPVIIDYKLTIKNSDDCLITVEGYQIDETIVCEAQIESNSVKITFKSYQNGSFVNKYGIAEYKPGFTLFTLSKVGQKTITTWDKMNNTSPLSPGVYFEPKN